TPPSSTRSCAAMRMPLSAWLGSMPRRRPCISSLPSNPKARRRRAPSGRPEPSRREACIMKLTQAQIAQFEDEGYLFLPNLFSNEEMTLLQDELPGIFAQAREEVVREKGSQAPRSAFYVQHWNPVFSLLARHPRLVEPGMQLLESNKL